MKFVKIHSKTNSGEVTAKAFYKDLPENLTEDSFKAVDDYRERMLSRVMNEVLDYATEHEITSDFIVSDIPMGGTAVSSVILSPEMKLVAETHYVHGDLMKEVMDRAQTLFLSSNVVDDEEDPDNGL